MASVILYVCSENGQTTEINFQMNLKRNKMKKKGIAFLMFLCCWYSSSAFKGPGHLLIEQRAYELLKDSTAKGLEIYNFLYKKEILTPGLKSAYPDFDFKRQLLAERQVYHFMASYKFVTEAMKKNKEERQSALLKLALKDCIEVVYLFFREIIDNHKGADQAGRGIYVLMHIIADSYSREHTTRTETNDLLTIKSWRLSKLRWSEAEKERDSIIGNQVPTLKFLHTIKGHADDEYSDQARSNAKTIVLTKEAEAAAAAIRDLLVAVYQAKKDTTQTDELITSYIEKHFKPYASNIVEHRFIIQDDITQISFKQLYDTSEQVTLKFDFYTEWSFTGLAQFNLMNGRDNAQGVEIGYYHTPAAASARGAFFRRIPFGLSGAFIKNNLAVAKEKKYSDRDLFQTQLFVNACSFLPWYDIMVELKFGYGCTPLNTENLHHSFVGGVELLGYVGEHAKVGLGWQYDAARLPSLNSFYIKFGFDIFQSRVIIKHKKEPET
jgi:hypothetical protein